MEQPNIQEIIDEAIKKYSIIPSESQMEITNAKINLQKFIKEELIFDSSDGITCITTDPKEEFDDLVMLRFGITKIIGTCYVVISGGYFTPDERFDYLKTLFKCFEGAEFDKEFPVNENKGKIIFKRDGYEFKDDEKIKRFINCGPCSSKTLNSIKFVDNPIIITVGANDDGTLGAGINQKQTDTEGTLTNIPDVWNNFINNAKNVSKATIKNMSVNVTRFVLFPNPTKYEDKESSFYKELNEQSILNAMIKSTAMFLVSRPPPAFALRVNEGNSIIDIQLYPDLLKKSKKYSKPSSKSQYKKYKPSRSRVSYERGLNKLNEYIELTNKIQKDDETKKQIYTSAAIPIMITNFMGGEYKPGTFGWAPTDKEGKETLSCLTPESAGKVLNYITNSLTEFTPAYDPLAFIEAFNVNGVNNIKKESKFNDDDDLSIYREFKSEDGRKYYYDVVNDHSSWKKPKENIFINTNINKDWILIESSRLGQFYFHNTKTHKSQWKQPIENVEGLDWIGNSCYLDSVLMCLFLIPNKSINDEILFKKNLKNKKCSSNRQKEIQKSLKKIVLSIRGTNKKIKNCTNLRKKIKECLIDSDQKFYNTTTNDSDEFLLYLLQLFEVETCTEIETRKIKYKKEIISEKYQEEKINPIIRIHGDVDLIEKLKIKDFLNFTEEEEMDEYKYKGKVRKVNSVRQTIYKDFPFIVFNYNRLEKRDKFLKTEINATETFINDDKEYELYGIVIHNGENHYVAMLKLDDDWYFYNDTDTDNTITNIGSYEQMIKYKCKCGNKVKPLTHGTLFFYKLKEDI